MLEEQRRYIRYRTNLNVKYFYTRDRVSIEDKSFAKDISLCGMRLHLSSALKKGAIFIIEMRLPFSGTVSAVAKVTWTKPDDLRQAQNHSPETSGSGSVQAGVLFDWVSDVNKLATYIEKLQLKAA